MPRSMLAGVFPYRGGGTLDANVPSRERELIATEKWYRGASQRLHA